LLHPGNAVQPFERGPKFEFSKSIHMLNGAESAHASPQDTLMDFTLLRGAKSHHIGGFPGPLTLRKRAIYGLETIQCPLLNLWTGTR